MAPNHFSPYLRLIQKTGATKHPYGFYATDLLLKRIPWEGTKEVLDVGCGAGHSSAYIAEHYDCMVTGVDFSDDAIDKAQALHANNDCAPRLKFLVADALRLPFADHSFDVVMCESVLFFIEDKAAAIKEMTRVLKPSGYLALNETVVADTEKKQTILEYFTRPQFGGFLVTAADLTKVLVKHQWSIILQDEKPFDLTEQLTADLKNLFTLKNVLPFFEMAHQAFVDKEMRDDVVSVIKFMVDMPTSVMNNLYSYLLLAQKKPPK